MSLIWAIDVVPQKNLYIPMHSVLLGLSAGYNFNLCTNNFNFFKKIGNHFNLFFFERRSLFKKFFNTLCFPLYKTNSFYDNSFQNKNKGKHLFSHKLIDYPRVSNLKFDGKDLNQARKICSFVLRATNCVPQGRIPNLL